MYLLFLFKDNLITIFRFHTVFTFLFHNNNSFTHSVITSVDDYKPRRMIVSGFQFDKMFMSGKIFSGKNFFCPITRPKKKKIQQQYFLSRLTILALPDKS